MDIDKIMFSSIPNDQGIKRKLTRICPPGQTCSIDIHERNILRIVLNRNQEIMVDEDIVSIEEIKGLFKLFLDNNGDKSCEYCNGQGLPEFSDNPTKTIISLQVDTNTHYNVFIQVQDQLTNAYYELREHFARKTYGKSPNELTSEELKIVREAYPFLVSEATID